MEFVMVKQEQWEGIKEIYMEAFPKEERKPFGTLRKSVQTGKAQILTATENDALLGFVMLIPYKDMVMVDYLAVSGRVRSKGTGSRLMQEVCRRYGNKRVVLLIERLDDTAQNREQRIARRKFYLKNNFTSTNIFTTGAGGNMEVMHFGAEVAPQEYLELQKYALGRVMFWFSRIRIEG